MTASLLERVKFIGGGGGAGTPEPETPELFPPGPGLPLLEPDPEPAPETRAKAKSAASSATAKSQKRTGGRFVSNKAVQAQIADELDSYAKLLALTWSMTDEHCAGVLNDTSAAIAADLARLIGRSDYLVEKFQTTSLIGDCFKLLHSAFPLIRAIWQHHASPAARAARDDDEGEPGYEPVTVAEPTIVDPAGYAPWRPSIVGDAV